MNEDKPSALAGIPLIIDREAIHGLVIYTPDIAQCINCGRWTRYGRAMLNTVPCQEAAEETPTWALEVLP